MIRTLNKSKFKLEDILTLSENNKIPFNVEAEQAVLGSILLDYHCLDDVAEILPSCEYFYMENQMLKLYQNNLLKY